MRRAFTLVGVLVTLAILATLAALLVPAFQAARANANRRPGEVPESQYLMTSRHDGHLWIVAPALNQFMHHPDCPCHGKAERDDQGK